MKIDKKKILIIDNDFISSKLLEQSLSDEYDAFITQSGNEALILIPNNPPDLILLDIVMPGMDGFELCKKLKTDGQFIDIPIIFITAKDDVEDQLIGLKLGAADYVTKPFSIPIVKARISTHLRLKEKLELLEKESRKRKELLHMLSHDLLNPIGAAIGFNSMILDEPNLILEHQSRISFCLDHAYNIIEAAKISLSIDEQNISTELTPHLLIALMAEAIQLVDHRSRQKQINIKFLFDPAIVIMVAPTIFINSVLCNILVNAIKFSHPGSTIEVTAESSADNVIIKIIDYGIGIPKEMLPTIFELGKNKSRLGTQKEKGTGFGMSLIKKSVETQLGTVAIDSSEEKGTSIILSMKKGKFTEFKIFDFQELLDKVGGKENVLNNLIDYFKKDNGELSEQLQLALIDSPSDESFKNAKDLIHTLRGVAGNLTFYELAHHARILEEILKKETKPTPEELKTHLKNIDLALKQVFQKISL